jgi:chromosome segregation ATPase
VALRGGVDVVAGDVAGQVREHFDRMKVEKEKDLLRDNLQKLRKREHESEDYLSQMAAETAKLNTIINEADKERQRQRKECEIVVNERDILGTQLIRRNEELSLLYERIRIQKSTLQKGEQQYNARVREIGALKRRIRELSTEMGGLKGSVTNLETLRNEVYQLQRELLQERTKVRALSEELENPMNVHRWRKLEGSDPATYELVQKTHMLQKRLIEKSEEVVDKDLLIHHKEKLYVELKNILARQPGPEVAEQLSTYQQSLSERSKQMEQMEAELTMSHTQAAEYKHEIARISRELVEVKKKFFEQRKREQQLTEQRRAERTQPTELLVQEARSTLNRFTGGGFSERQRAVTPRAHVPTPCRAAHADRHDRFAFPARRPQHARELRAAGLTHVDALRAARRDAVVLHALYVDSVFCRRIRIRAHLGES